MKQTIDIYKQKTMKPNKSKASLPASSSSRALLKKNTSLSNSIPDIGFLGNQLGQKETLTLEQQSKDWTTETNEKQQSKVIQKDETINTNEK